MKWLVLCLVVFLGLCCGGSSGGELNTVPHYNPTTEVETNATFTPFASGITEYLDDQRTVFRVGEEEDFAFYYRMLTGIPLNESSKVSLQTHKK
jgi:hypothetical protein